MRTQTTETSFTQKWEEEVELENGDYELIEHEVEVFVTLTCERESYYANDFTADWTWDAESEVPEFVEDLIEATIEEKFWELIYD